MGAGNRIVVPRVVFGRGGLQPQALGLVWLFEAFACLLPPAPTSVCTLVAPELATSRYAPESRADASWIVSVKTDVYALGVTFYEMLTSRKPFEFLREDEPLRDFALRVCQGTATPPSAYRPIPANLEKIVLKSIAQNPKVPSVPASTA